MNSKLTRYYPTSYSTFLFNNRNKIIYIKMIHQISFLNIFHRNTYIYTSKGKEKDICLRIVYEIIERTIDKYGQIFLTPDIEVNTWWTNLDWNDDAVIKSYHAHGECEQYHSELKTDMDVERLPSGKFDTNELVLELALVAFNILRMIGQESLKYKKPRHAVRRRRIRTVLFNIIQCASHITEHARKTLMGLGCSNTWREAFGFVWKKFAYC